mmetsp:Transcript_2142/g.6911  ORF Transcript_2142/g.6911 Transcript_2142/m.6911 type:complete len:355 (+) Transcript_2142:146-1210(+)
MLDDVPLLLVAVPPRARRLGIVLLVERHVEQRAAALAPQPLERARRAQLRDRPLWEPLPERGEVRAGGRVEHAIERVPARAAALRGRLVLVGVGEPGAAAVAHQRRVVLWRLRLLGALGLGLWSRRRGGGELVGGRGCGGSHGRGDNPGSGRWREGLPLERRPARATLVGDEELRVDVFAVEGDELAVAEERAAELGEEGVVEDGRRDAVDDAQLARVAVREDGLARVHRHGSLARLLRAHRVAKRDAACEGVVDVTRVALRRVVQALVQLGRHREPLVQLDVLVALAEVLGEVDAVAKGGARVCAGEALVESVGEHRQQRARLRAVQQQRLVHLAAQRLARQHRRRRRRQTGG